MQLMANGLLLQWPAEEVRDPDVNPQVTGKELLSKGQLKKRVTIIPLNKIDGNVVRTRIPLDTTPASC